MPAIVRKARASVAAKNTAKAGQFARMAQGPRAAAQPLKCAARIQNNHKNSW